MDSDECDHASLCLALSNDRASSTDADQPDGISSKESTPSMIFDEKVENELLGRIGERDASDDHQQPSNKRRRRSPSSAAQDGTVPNEDAVPPSTHQTVPGRLPPPERKICPKRKRRTNEQLPSKNMKKEELEQLQANNKKLNEAVHKAFVLLYLFWAPQEIAYKTDRLKLLKEKYSELKNLYTKLSPKFILQLIAIPATHSQNVEENQDQQGGGVQSVWASQELENFKNQLDVLRSNCRDCVTKEHTNSDILQQSIRQVEREIKSVMNSTSDKKETKQAKRLLEWLERIRKVAITVRNLTTEDQRKAALDEIDKLRNTMNASKRDHKNPDQKKSFEKKINELDISISTLLSTNKENMGSCFYWIHEITMMANVGDDDRNQSQSIHNEVAALKAEIDKFNKSGEDTFPDEELVKETIKKESGNNCVTKTTAKKRLPEKNTAKEDINELPSKKKNYKRMRTK